MEPVCRYWDMEAYKAMTDKEPFNEFLFDLFHKMLFHQGFADEGCPFYLGYKTAKYKTRI